MNSVTQNTAISNEVVAVKFYDDTLITLEKDGEHYVAVRPIVENMGLDWTTQAQKLKSPKFNCRHMPTVAQDGKIREVLCMPIKKLNGWLFSINPQKVRGDIRHIVEQYQEECFTVLHDYWNEGVAINPRFSSVDDRRPLIQAVNKFVKQTNLSHKDVWGMLHDQFNIKSADELDINDIRPAIAYLHGLLMIAGKSDTADYNAFWRTVGLMEYDRVTTEIRELQRCLDVLSQKFFKLSKSTGLIFDALNEQATGSLMPFAERRKQAQDFLDKHRAKKQHYLH